MTQHKFVSVKDFWPVIRIPIFILVGWSLLSVIAAKISMDIYLTVFGSSVNLVVGILVYLFVGYNLVAEHKQEPFASVKAGVWTGVFSGFGIAILGIVSVFFVPEIFTQAINTAVATGASKESVMNLLRLGAYLSLLIQPIIGAVSGAVFSGITGWATKKFFLKK